MNLHYPHFSYQNLLCHVPLASISYKINSIDAQQLLLNLIIFS